MVIDIQFCFEDVPDKIKRSGGNRGKKETTVFYSQLSSV